MSTKIGSHRIESGAIKKTHLESGMKFAEGTDLILNHPTHSNANDLNRDQYLALTQMGFADHLHKHSGGGGGDAGIYTNKQRDAMLLDLMMMFSSQVYRLENSLMDDFDNPDGIYMGLEAPKINMIDELLSATDNKSLEPSTMYSYRIAQKSGGNMSEACMPVSKTTTDIATSNYRKFRLVVFLDEKNEGVKIWRSKGAVGQLALPFNAFSSLRSTASIPYKVVPDSSPSGGNSLIIEYIGSGGVIRDMANPMYGGVPIGEPVSITKALNMDQEVRFGYRNSNWTYPIHELYVAFGDNPAEIPVEFDIQYSKIDFPDIYSEEGWMPLPCTFKEGTLFSGTIIEGKVRNNTTRALLFTVDKVNATAIRFVVKRHLGAFRFNYLRSLHKLSHIGEYMTHEIKSGNFDMSQAKTLIIDVKGDEDHSKYAVGFRNAKDTGFSVFDNAVNWDCSTATNWNIGVQPNRVVRTAFHVQGTIPTGTNKFRFRFGTNSSWVSEIESVSFSLSTNAPSSPVITMPEYTVPVTFDGGNFTGKNSGKTYIESDWIDIPVITNNPSPVTILITFKLTSGNLYCYSVGGRYIYYKDNDDTVLNDPNFTGGNVWQNDYCVSVKVEFGKSFRSIILPSLPSKNRDKWFKHYLDLSAIKGNYTELNKLLYVLTGIQKNGQVRFANAKISDAEIYTDTKRAQIVATATDNTSGNTPANGWNNNIGNYWESNTSPTVINPVGFMLKFPEQVKLDMVRIMEAENNLTYGFEQYEFQYTIDDTALVTDPLNSPKWQRITSLSYTPDYEFSQEKGNITLGLVQSSRLFSEIITHIFEPTVMKAIRFLVHKTNGNTRARLRNMALYSSETASNYELIYESNEKEDETFTFIDEISSGTLDLPNLINTTGSDNILYDSSLELVKVYDRGRKGTFLSKVVDTENFSRVLIRTQSVDPDDSIELFVSNDGGDTFVPITIGDVVQMPSIGNKFVIKAHLYHDDQLSAYSVLYSL